MTSRIEEALSLADKGYSCGQAILGTYGPFFDLDRDTAYKLASSMAAGFGGQGQTCGAVTGAYLVIGLRFGSSNVDEIECRELTFELVQQFTQTFESWHNSTQCNTLLGHDITTMEGLKTVRQQGLARKLCPAFIRSAIEILEALLWEDYG